MKKSKLLCFSTALIMAVPAANVTVSCSKKVPVEKVNFNYEYSYVKVSTAKDFSKEVKITPENATDKTLTWSLTEQSTPDVAKVSQDGLVTAQTTGYAKLVCSSTADTSKVAEQWIIFGDYEPLKDFELVDKELTIYQNDSYAIRTKFVPEDATTAKTQYVKWTSSDDNIVSVDNYGNIKANNTGDATITAVPYDYDVSTSAFVPIESLAKTCHVNITKAVIKDFHITPENITVKPGQQFMVRPTILPAEISQECSYLISDTNIISSYDPNTFTATAGNVEGSANIFFTSKYDETKIAHCTVTVQKDVCPVQTIEFNQTSKTLKCDETWQPEVTVTPDAATYKDYFFVSKDTSIVQIENYKTIKAVAPGTTQITVWSEDGKHCSQTPCQITVSPTLIEKIDLTSVTCRLDDSFTLTPVITPADAHNKNLLWSSSDETIAYVNDEGLVSALRNGTAIITATAKDGSGVRGECTVTVTNGEIVQVDSIHISPSQFNISRSTPPQEVTAQVLPENATNKNVTWHSSDPSVVEIIYTSGTQGIKIKPKKAGVTKLTATSYDNKVTSNICTITVIDNDPESIELSFTTKRLQVGDEITIFSNVYPSTAKQDVTWHYHSVDAQRFISLSENGHIKGMYPGRATVRCESAVNPNVYALCTIFVRDVFVPVEDISFLVDSIDAECNKTYDLPLVWYEPITATNKDVVWTTDPESTGKISIDPENNKFTALSPGKVILRCTSVDTPAATCKCDINIDQIKPTSIKIVSYPETLSWNQKGKIVARVEPEGYVSQEVIYKNLDTLDPIVDVDEEGDVSYKKEGLAHIEVSSKNYPNVKKVVTIKTIAYVSFANDSWENVILYARGGLDELHSRYSLDVWRNRQFPFTLLGCTRTIMLNYQPHKVKVIGENHDDLVGEPNKATLTFQTVTAYSDSSGPKYTKWDSSNNRDFLNSTLQKNITGKGKASKGCWDKSIDQVLSEEEPYLHANLKRVVKKQVTGRHYDVHTYEATLFPISTVETGYDHHYTYYGDEGQPYEKLIHQGAEMCTDLNGNRVWYWFRSAYLDTQHSYRDAWAFYRMYENPPIDEQNVCVSFCFCI